MEMARIAYSAKAEGENIARGKANELPISPKHAIEIANFIRHRRVNDAIADLGDVAASERRSRSGTSTGTWRTSADSPATGTQEGTR